MTPEGGPEVRAQDFKITEPGNHSSLPANIAGSLGREIERDVAPRREIRGAAEPQEKSAGYTSAGATSAIHHDHGKNGKTLQDISSSRFNFTGKLV